MSHDVAHRGISSVTPVVESAVQRAIASEPNVAAQDDAPARVTPVRSTWLFDSHVPGGLGGLRGEGGGGGDGGGEGGGGEGGGEGGGGKARRHTAQFELDVPPSASSVQHLQPQAALLGEYVSDHWTTATGQSECWTAAHRQSCTWPEGKVPRFLPVCDAHCWIG